MNGNVGRSMASDLNRIDVIVAEETVALVDLGIGGGLHGGDQFLDVLLAEGARQDLVRERLLVLVVLFQPLAVERRVDGIRGASRRVAGELLDVADRAFVEEATTTHRSAGDGNGWGSFNHFDASAWNTNIYLGHLK